MSRGFWVGLAAGLAVAIGGAIKDAPYEGFSASTFIRSPLVGALAGELLEKKYPGLPTPILFLSSIALERIVIEAYKLIRAINGSYVPGKFLHGEWGVAKKLTPEGEKRLQVLRNPAIH